MKYLKNFNESNSIFDENDIRNIQDLLIDLEDKWKLIQVNNIYEMDKNSSDSYSLVETHRDIVKIRFFFKLLDNSKSLIREIESDIKSNLDRLKKYGYFPKIEKHSRYTVDGYTVFPFNILYKNI